MSPTLLVQGHVVPALTPNQTIHENDRVLASEYDLGGQCCILKLSNLTAYNDLQHYRRIGYPSRTPRKLDYFSLRVLPSRMAFEFSFICCRETKTHSFAAEAKAILSHFAHCTFSASFPLRPCNNTQWMCYIAS